MKYSQFLELDNVLNENNITVEDIKENHNVLNEIGVAALIGGGILGLATIFRKHLLRLGLKKYYLIKLNNASEKFKEKLIQISGDMAQKMAKTRETITKKEEELKDNPQSAEYKAFITQKLHYEKKMYDYGLKRISKYVEKKSEQVERMIDESTKLKDSQKLALKLYWDGLVPDMELSAFKVLIDKGIITNKSIIEKINTNFKQEKEKLTKEFNDFANNIQNKGTTKKEEPKKETKPKDEVEQKSLKPDKL